MIEISLNENDDKDFIEIVEKTLNTSIQNLEPFEVFIIKIDNWFDYKWQSFSGKTHGELGVSFKELRIPPFIPDRIIKQFYYQNVNNSYAEKEPKNLHIYQQSDANFNRKLKHFSNSAIFLWFSGNTKGNLRGSIMLYQIENEIQNSWYVSFAKKEYWQVNKTSGISRNEILALT